jgi:hypothetical protein
MRTDIVKLIQQGSPKAPACFDSQAQWVEYLVSAHSAGRKVVRRVDTGKSAGKRETHFEVLPVGKQSHCAECSVRRKEAMQAAARCFPVAAPKAAQEPDTGADETLGSRFEVSGIATLNSLKPKKRGSEDDRYLAVELSVSFPKVAASVCAYFDDMLTAFLYRQELGCRVVRNPAMRPISFARTIVGAAVDIEGQKFTNADVSRFVLQPIDGVTVSLACRITIYPGKANCNALIGRIKEGVRIRIEGPDDLFTAPDGRHKKQRQQDLAVGA